MTAVSRTVASVYVLPRSAIAPLLSANAALASAFERSMRRGLAILDRQVAARAAPALGVREQALLRLRQLLGLQHQEEIVP